ncbi:transcription initiation factor TFIID subunit 4-like [Stigmatopora argus]
MASNKDPTALGCEGDPAVQVKLQQVAAKLVPSPAVSNRDVRPAVSAAASPASAPAPPASAPAPPASAPAPPAAAPAPPVAAPAPPAAAPAVMVVTKLANPVGTGVHAPKATVGQVTTVKATSAPGRTLLITVPRSTGPPVTPLLTNIQIPPGMVLLRSERGQLMLMTQQALAQAQQVGRLVTTPAPPASTAPRQTNEKVGTVTVAPPALQPPPNQKTATVKVMAMTPKAGAPPTRAPATETRAPVEPVAVETRKEPQPVYSQETLESVKKCKNFLVTLMKLASSDSRSPHMANNVRGLVRSLLEGELEAEGFTEALYQELKSTPQPCLVPFLKKSLPAVRRLTADPQVFIQQACGSSSSGPAANKSSSGPKPLPQASGGVGGGVGGGANAGVSGRSPILTSVTNPKATPVVQMGKKIIGGFTINQPFSQDRPRSIPPANRISSSSYKEDDDINDVPCMAGVNLPEENAHGLTSAVGSVVRSCQDQSFLSAGPALGRILRAGRPLGVTEVVPEAVALVSHATQEFLRGLLETLSVAAEHRKVTPKEDCQHERANDARSQLRFLEGVEAYKKKKRDEEERERLMRLVRSRSHAEDPLLQQMKQRAKEMQQMEEAQTMHRQANLTALAAIGPRKKRALDLPQGSVASGAGPRQTLRRPTRVVLRDLLLCMEHDRFLRHSLTLYKAML